MNYVENVISQLGTQRSAIDRASSALREVAAKSPLAKVTSPSSNGQPRKKQLSPQGRRRIIEAATGGQRERRRTALMSGSSGSRNRNRL